MAKVTIIETYNRSHALDLSDGSVLRINPGERIEIDESLITFEVSNEIRAGKLALIRPLVEATSMTSSVETATTEATPAVETNGKSSTKKKSSKNNK